MFFLQHCAATAGSTGGLHGGAGGMWFAGSEASWSADDDDSTWLGCSEPVRVSTDAVPPGARVVLLRGPHPRIFMTEPLSFDTNKVRLCAIFETV